MKGQDHWLEDWVRESLRAVIPEEARIRAQEASPYDICIDWPAPDDEGADRRLRSITLHFDQGVHASISVATPELRRLMGKRLQELFDRSVSQSYNTLEPLEEALTVHVDSSIAASSGG